MFNSKGLWRKVLYGLGLMVLSAWTTVVLFQFLHRSWPTTTVATVTSPLPVVQTSPQPPPLSFYQRQLLSLRRLHAQAAPISIDQLVAQAEGVESQTLEWVSATQTDLASSQPQQYRIAIDKTNFGDRRTKDVKGRPVNQPLLIVLHETTSTADSAVNAMLTPHPRDEDQVSYHAIVRQDGAIIYSVDPLKRAYGAGNSAFNGEQVQTNKALAASVNNFAYHISLETPMDGYDDKAPEHSGYTSQQYGSLAWLIAHSGVDPQRITTHAAIDQAGERQDPRSFEMDRLLQMLELQSAGLVSFATEPTSVPSLPQP
ncbi:MAG TPA: peptidoglycan recognition family protein [Stenomitos sp.]